MAGINTKYGNEYNQPIREYIVTSIDEIADLPTTTTDAKGKFADDVNFQHRPCIGSICQVVADSGLLVYMLNENGWQEI